MVVECTCPAEINEFLFQMLHLTHITVLYFVHNMLESCEKVEVPFIQTVLGPLRVNYCIKQQQRH